MGITDDQHCCNLCGEHRTSCNLCRGEPSQKVVPVPPCPIKRPEDKRLAEELNRE